MKPALVQKDLLVKPSSIKGYGVFANEDIEDNALIEECHVILMKEKVNDLKDYVFGAGDFLAVALGYGSIYNHSDFPNAKFEYDEERSLMVFRAKGAIKKGEEIYVSYGNHWFNYRQMKVKESRWRYRLYKQLPLFGFIGRFAIIVGAIMAFISLKHLLVMFMTTKFF